MWCIPTATTPTGWPVSILHLRSLEFLDAFDLLEGSSGSTESTSFLYKIDRRVN